MSGDHVDDICFFWPFFRALFGGISLLRQAEEVGKQCDTRVNFTSFAGFHTKMYNFIQELCSGDGLSAGAVEMLWPVLC